MGGGRLREVIAPGGSTILHSGFKPHSYVRTFTFTVLFIRDICWYLVQDIGEERKDNSGAKS